MRDADVRRAVKRQLSALHAEDSDTLIVEEMGVWAGTVRVDIAVINGELTGFELKSDRDTLQRLPLQADIYSRVFDRMTLVVGLRHAEKAAAIVPSWWGIVEAAENRGSIELSEQRASQQNPSLEPYVVAELLRREEALAVLERFSLAKGWRGKRIKLVHQRLASELPLPVLCLEVRTALKQRADWLRKDGVHQVQVPTPAAIEHQM